MGSGINFIDNRKLRWFTKIKNTFEVVHISYIGKCGRSRTHDNLLLINILYVLIYIVKHKLTVSLKMI